MNKTREEVENAIFRMRILKREGKQVDQIIFELEQELFELCDQEIDAEDNSIG